MEKEKHEQEVLMKCNFMKIPILVQDELMKALATLDQIDGIG